MRASMKRFWTSAALVAAALGVLLLAVVIPVLGTQAPFSAYNPGPAGASGLAKALHARSAFAPSLLPGEDGALIDATSFARRDITDFGGVLVLQPVTEADEEERRWLETFLRQGGVVVVAASTPAADSFLRGLVETRVGEGAVLDFAYTRAPAFPLVEPRGDPLFAGVSRLVLTRPAPLLPGEGAEVLATTGAHSFVDADGDGLRSEGEALGPRPWLVRHAVGPGELLILSDPFLLTNGMAPVADGAAFRRNVADRLAAGGDVLVDESHRGDAQAVRLLDVGFASVPAWLRVVLPLLAYLGLAVPLLRGSALARASPRRWLERLARVPDAPPPSAEDVRRMVLRRHPGWSAERVDEAMRLAEAPR